MLMVEGHGVGNWGFTTSCFNLAAPTTKRRNTKKRKKRRRTDRERNGNGGRFILFYFYNIGEQKGIKKNLSQERQTRRAITELQKWKRRWERKEHGAEYVDVKEDKKGVKREEEEREEDGMTRATAREKKVTKRKGRMSR